MKAPELYTGNCGTVCVSICYCLFTSPSKNIERKFCNMIYWGSARTSRQQKGGRGSCVCTASSCQNLNGNEFVYGVAYCILVIRCYDKRRECSYDLPAEGICNGTLVFAIRTMGMGICKVCNGCGKFINRRSFKIDLVLWQRKRQLQFCLRTNSELTSCAYIIEAWRYSINFYNLIECP